MNKDFNLSWLHYCSESLCENKQWWESGLRDVREGTDAVPRLVRNVWLEYCRTDNQLWLVAEKWAIFAKVWLA